MSVCSLMPTDGSTCAVKEGRDGGGRRETKTVQEIHACNSLSLLEDSNVNSYCVPGGKSPLFTSPVAHVWTAETVLPHRWPSGDDVMVPVPVHVHVYTCM